MDNTQEVRFSEGLAATQIYTYVELHFEGEKLFTINEGPIIL